MAEIYTNIGGKPVILDEDEYADYLDFSYGNRGRVLGRDYDDSKDVLDVERYLDREGVASALEDRKRERRNALQSMYDYPELSSVSSVQQSDWDDDDHRYEVELKNLIGSVRPGVRKAIGKAGEILGRLEEPLLGKENEDYRGEKDFFDKIPTAAYIAAPFINPALGIGLYGASVMNDVYKGKRTPGMLDLLIAGQAAKGAVRGVGNAARAINSGTKAFSKSYKAAKAARAAENARTLPGTTYVKPPKYTLYDIDGTPISTNEGKWYSRWK